MSSYPKQTQIDKAAFIKHVKHLSGCVDCGESDPVVLEFDHVRGEKKWALGNAAINRSYKGILAEIEKCQVRCANCHRRKSFLEKKGPYRPRDPGRVVSP